MPGSCEPEDENDACQVCIQELCCEQYEACNAYEPFNVCGWGGPDDWPSQGGEFLCYVDCINRNFDETGTEPNTVDLIDSQLENDCIAECATPACENIPGTATQDLAVCMRDCQPECFE